MTQSEINNNYNSICKLIEKQQLKEALEALQDFAQPLQIWQISDKIKALQDNYQMMLNYSFEGVKDPEQNKLYNQLIASSYKITEEVKEELNSTNANDYVFSQKRYFPFTQISTSTDLIAELEKYTNTISENCKEDALLKESLSNQLFKTIWFSGKNATHEISLIKRGLISENMLLSDKCIIISSLMLSLMRCFNEEKALLLIEYCSHNEEEISQRALVALLPILARYDKRLKFFPAIRNRLVVLMDNTKVLEHIKHIILQYARTNETEKISKKLKEEILPEMMKVAPKIKDKIDLDSLTKNDDSEEKNPEWQDILEESGIADKLKEFSDLQMEGSDVYMSTFAMLKNYPFFNEVGNWFKPFEGSQSDICELFEGEGKSLLPAIMKNGFMCSSDRYSFCLSLANMPASQRELMSKAFAMESEQMNEIQQDDEILAKTKKTEQISNTYIQDIYRFFNLFTNKQDFENPFEHSLNFQNTWFFSLAGFDMEEKREIAEYYFSKDFYPEAQEIFQEIEENSTKSLDLCQKIGFCYQKMGAIEEALKYYLEAEIILSNQKWTIRKIAYCYRVLKDFNHALEYYLKAEEMEPENLTVLTQIGNCFLNTKQYSEALAYYFKVEYVGSGNSKIWRAIAWTSFLANKISQSKKFLKKAMKEKEDWTDYLHLGHIAFVEENKKNTIANYEKAFVLGDKNLELFIETFHHDSVYLKEKGIDDIEIAIVLDYLRYSVE